MGRRILLSLGVGIIALAVSACEQSPAAGRPAPGAPEPDTTPRAHASVNPAAGAPRDRPVAAPVVIPGCRLKAAEKQDVPSQREGILLFIGSEIQPGEEVPPDRRVTVRVAGRTMSYRRLKEGDRVEAGQLLARLDDRLARDELAIRQTRLRVSEVDRSIAEKALDEARERFDREQRLLTRNATSTEQVRSAQLIWQKCQCEAVAKQEAIELARREVHQAETLLEMYEIRSSLAGVIKTIARNPGEAVRAYEPVFQVYPLDRLQVEGMAGVQDLPYLRRGSTVLVEPADVRGPRQALVGHLREVTGVAVSRDGAVVSAGEDGTVRVWGGDGREVRLLRHPGPVRAVACTSAGTSVGAVANACLAGTADGRAFIWELDGQAGSPRHELRDQHRGPVTCVAFSPDGAACATGGEDRAICLWDARTGALRCRLAAAHRAAVTSLQFVAGGRLVSAGRDHTVRLWKLQDVEARPEATLDSRSGAVTQLGAAADGRSVLFDHDKSLRLLALPEGWTRWVLESPSDAGGFAPLALLSPDGRLVLTGGGAEGGLRLWRAPGSGTRGHVLCQLTGRERTPVTCAAFAPDGSFVAAGTRERTVLVWPVPARAEVERRITAELTLVEQAVETTTGQVRVCAELANPDGRLLPGGTVTLVISPEP